MFKKWTSMRQTWDLTLGMEIRIPRWLDFEPKSKKKLRSVLEQLLWQQLRGALLRPVLQPVVRVQQGVRERRGPVLQFQPQPQPQSQSQRQRQCQRQPPLRLRGRRGAELVLERVLVLPALQAQQEHLPRRLPRQQGGWRRGYNGGRRFTRGPRGLRT